MKRFRWLTQSFMSCSEHVWGEGVVFSAASLLVTFCAFESFDGLPGWGLDSLIVGALCLGPAILLGLVALRCVKGFWKLGPLLCLALPLLLALLVGYAASRV